MLREEKHNVDPTNLVDPVERSREPKDEHYLHPRKV